MYVEIVSKIYLATFRQAADKFGVNITIAMPLAAHIVHIHYLHRKRGIYLSELTEQMGEPRASVARYVIRLREMGVVKEERDPFDMRRTLILPSEALVSMLEEWTHNFVPLLLGDIQEIKISDYLKPSPKNGDLFKEKPEETSD